MTNMSRIIKLVLGSQGSLCDKWKCERKRSTTFIIFTTADCDS